MSDAIKHYVESYRLTQSLKEDAQLAIAPYIDAAMATATYEEMEDHEGWFGACPALPGCWAHSDDLDDCKVELRKHVEAWVLDNLVREWELPDIAGISLT